MIRSEVPVALAVFALALGGAARAQDAGGVEVEKEERRPVELVVEPASPTLNVGERVVLRATVKDAQGEVMESPVVFYSRARRALTVTPTGRLEAYAPGKHVVVALVPRFADDPSRRPEGLIQVEVTVEVPPPPVQSVSFEPLPERVYAGTELPLAVTVKDTSGAERIDVPVSWASRTPGTARVDATGRLRLLAPGRVELTASAEEVTGETAFDAEADPVVRFALEADAETARTGDVVWFRAVARDASGEPVPGYPVQLACSSRLDPRIRAAGAACQIDADGAFVAERPGVHTVVAVAGPHAATRSLEVAPRDVRKRFEVVGHGAVRDRHTSDLWVWEGNDGRDYALTGTWGADGHAYMWDVTDPANMQIVDVVKVDARTVNDVKVSEDGRLAVISREGASNRRNGFVILDVSKPQEGVRILSRYDDQLAGGVHNVFVHDHHVYAINNGRRYDIINIEDPEKPARVGRFELDTPGHSIHDVWVVDGIAYSSNWDDGVVAVDVGGGGRGGAPNNPVKIGSATWPNGWNHAAYPWTSPSTGKRYVFGGDEAFPWGLHPEKGSPPERAAGWIHVFDVSDWSAPREVARYEVPEAGTHNLWIEGEVLYVAYYNAGLRAVDISGEMRGDLYRQGREIAFWFGYDPEGFIPNAPFAWGPQVHKGHVFVADYNSGLWALKLSDFDPEQGAPDLGEPR
jgi:hypothetical protein